MIDLIMFCVSSSSIPILINGNPSPYFKPTRGIRQGDPTSPYLFILCMERFSRSINLAIIQKDWNPIKISSNGPGCPTYSLGMTSLYLPKPTLRIVEPSFNSSMILKKALGKKWTIISPKSSFLKIASPPILVNALTFSILRKESSLKNTWGSVFFHIRPPMKTSSSSWTPWIKRWPVEKPTCLTW